MIKFLFIILPILMMALVGCATDENVVGVHSESVEEPISLNEEETKDELENEWYWRNEFLKNKYTEEEALKFVEKRETPLDVEEVLNWLQNEGMVIENIHIKDNINYYFSETVEWSITGGIDREGADTDVVLFEKDGMITFLRIRVFFPFEKPRIYNEVIEFYLWFISDVLEWEEGRMWFIEAWGKKKNGLYGNKKYIDYKGEYIWVDTSILPRQDSITSLIIQSAE